jgi:hypothetical protein
MALMMDAGKTSETSVKFYKTTRRHNRKNYKQKKFGEHFLPTIIHHYLFISLLSAYCLFIISQLFPFYSLPVHDLVIMSLLLSYYLFIFALLCHYFYIISSLYFPYIFFTSFFSHYNEDSEEISKSKIFFSLKSRQDSRTEPGPKLLFEEEIAETGPQP